MPAIFSPVVYRGLEFVKYFRLIPSIQWELFDYLWTL